MNLDPASLSSADRYKILIGCIVPRPIAFVSTVDHQGRTNLAPYSFFCGVGSEPMTLAFCPANTDAGTPKDTLRNALLPEEGGVGEFVVNLATEAYIREVSAAAEELPYGQSEFDLTGLTPEPSLVVRPPRLAQSPVSFECRTRVVLRLAPGVPAGANLVLGEVVHIRAHEGVLNDRLHADAEVLSAVARMGGATYCRSRERFTLPRGEAALRAPLPWNDPGHT